MSCVFNKSLVSHSVLKIPIFISSSLKFLNALMVMITPVLKDYCVLQRLRLKRREVETTLCHGKVVVCGFGQGTHEWKPSGSSKGWCAGCKFFINIVNIDKTNLQPGLSDLSTSSFWTHWVSIWRAQAWFILCGY